jgi:predicted deacylase
VTGQEEGPVFVVIAGIHGDEYEGPESIARVYQQLQPEQVRDIAQHYSTGGSGKHTVGLWFN